MAAFLRRLQKRKRNREGYDEFSTVMFKSAPVLTFIKAVDPVLALSSYNQFTFDGEENAEYGTAD